MGPNMWTNLERSRAQSARPGKSAKHDVARRDVIESVEAAAIEEIQTRRTPRSGLAPLYNPTNQRAP